MTTDSNVQKEATSQGATVSKETTSQGATVSTPQPSAEDKVAELVAKKIQEEIAKREPEIYRRAIQSVGDKYKADIEEAQRRMHEAELSTGIMRNQLRNSDPDAYKNAELARFQAMEVERIKREQEGKNQKFQTEFHGKFQDSLRSKIQKLGVDPDNSGIDWTVRNGDYLEAQERILESAIAVKTNKDAEKDKLLQDLQKRVKAIESESQEVNSVDTAGSLGTSSGIPTNIETFRRWVRENPDEYRKNRKKVEEMQRKGLIK